VAFCGVSDYNNAESSRDPRKIRNPRRKKEGCAMELAKVTLRGQITIPVSIRRKLNIREGDKVVFFEKEGRIFVENAALLALRDVQESFRGEAEKIREERHAGDA
jgi:AbrB family looped-hinge helix DNA binding protein